MCHFRFIGVILFSLVYFMNARNTRKMNAGSYEGSAKTSGYGEKQLPQPYATGSAENFSEVTGWKGDEKPVAPAGFTVTKFAD